MNFPNNFVWGAATSAYQAEGSAYSDGKGLSIWDVFDKKPGAILNGDTGDVSFDHYKRYKEDIAIMKGIGIKAYRLSISWSRILPDGNGKVNQIGLDFYDRLIDELLSADISPYVTLFHWDFPYELYKRGGWLNNESPLWFFKYAEIVTKQLSDRVSHWFTMNEPVVALIWGHQFGIHAPGIKLGMPELLTIAHNMLIANGMANSAIRNNTKGPCVVGEAFVGSIFTPETEMEDDIKAAKHMMFESEGENLVTNSIWMDPLIFGRYPNNILNLHEKYNVKTKQNDMNLIKQPIDFLGINIYNSEKARMGLNGKVEVVKRAPGYPKMAVEDWPVTPESLYWGPKFFYERYAKPIIISENGFSNCDWISLDGKVHDPQRIDFMNRYLLEYKKAIDEGIECLGYFYWSIFDDFEWAWGYNERFGLTYVDFQTQQRVIKDSGHWYKKVIESNGGILKTD